MARKFGRRTKAPRIRCVESFFFLPTLSHPHLSSHCPHTLSSHHRTLVTMRSLTTLSFTCRAVHTSSVRLARPRDASAASQPVLKRDAPAAPAPPVRPTRAGASTTTPTSEAAPVARGGKPGSILSSYKALPYNTKLVFWACGAGRFPSHPSNSFPCFSFLFTDSSLFRHNPPLREFPCYAVFATLGLLTADKLEELFPARNNRTKPPPSTDPETLAKFITHQAAPAEMAHERKPKLFSVSVVDRST